MITVPLAPRRGAWGGGGGPAAAAPPSAATRPSAAAFGGRQAPLSFGGGLRPFRLPVFPGEKIKFSYLVHPARLLPTYT